MARSTHVLIASFEFLERRAVCDNCDVTDIVGYLGDNRLQRLQLLNVTLIEMSYRLADTVVERLDVVDYGFLVFIDAQRHASQFHCLLRKCSTERRVAPDYLQGLRLRG